MRTHAALYHQPISITIPVLVTCHGILDKDRIFQGNEPHGRQQVDAYMGFMAETYSILDKVTSVRLHVCESTWALFIFRITIATLNLVSPPIEY